MDSLLTTTAVSAARASRYSMVGKDARTEETLDNGDVIHGRVYVGKDRNGRPSLVHTVNGTEVAIPVHAVATAIATATVFSPDAVAAVFAETGKLAKLATAVAKLTPEPPAK